jgi:hypothetical protein
MAGGFGTPLRALSRVRRGTRQFGDATTTTARRDDKTDAFPKRESDAYASRMY